MKTGETLEAVDRVVCAKERNPTARQGFGMTDVVCHFLRVIATQHAPRLGLWDCAWTKAKVAVMSQGGWGWPQIHEQFGMPKLCYKNCTQLCQRNFPPD